MGQAPLLAVEVTEGVMVAVVAKKRVKNPSAHIYSEGGDSGACSYLEQCEKMFSKVNQQGHMITHLTRSSVPVNLWNKGTVLCGYGNLEPIPVPEHTYDHIITVLPIPVPCLSTEQELLT